MGFWGLAPDKMDFVRQNPYLAEDWRSQSGPPGGDVGSGRINEHRQLKGWEMKKQKTNVHQKIFRKE